MRGRRTRQRGYTLVELMLVIALLAVVASMLMPRFDLVLQKANQATAKGALGQVRTALNIYYTGNNGEWPFSGMPDGWVPETGSASLTSVLVPEFFSALRPPKLRDRMGSFNGLAGSFDDRAIANMSLSPPKDVYILRSPPDYTPFVDTPFVFNPQDGTLTYANGNFDTSGQYFYTW